MKDTIKIVSDTIKSVANSANSVNGKIATIDKNWFEILLENNPGVITILITGLVLPLALVYLNNRNSINLKKLEKELENDHKKDDIIKNQERGVYAALSKILFDVQQLHVSLSGNCVDNKCIENSLTKFDESIIKYHEEIANNMLYMPSSIINLVYEFYGTISDLKITLKELNESKEYEMAHVSVYMNSIELANILISIQEDFLQKDEKLMGEFDKTAQEMMKYCCGRKPPEELFNRFIEQYKALKPSLKEDDIEKLRRRFNQI
jgi:hypothetical protein